MSRPLWFVTILALIAAMVHDGHWQSWLFMGICICFAISAIVAEALEPS